MEVHGPRRSQGGPWRGKTTMRVLTRTPVKTHVFLPLLHSRGSAKRPLLTAGNSLTAKKPRWSMEVHWPRRSQGGPWRGKTTMRVVTRTPVTTHVFLPLLHSRGSAQRPLLAAGNSLAVYHECLLHLWGGFSIKPYARY